MSTKAPRKPLTTNKTSAILTSYTTANANINATAIPTAIRDTSLTTAAFGKARAIAANTDAAEAEAAAILCSEKSLKPKVLRKTWRHRPYDQIAATNTNTTATTTRTKSETKTTTLTSASTSAPTSSATLISTPKLEATLKPHQPHRQQLEKNCKIKRPLFTNTFATTSSSLTAALAAALLHTTNATTATLNAATAFTQTHAATNTFEASASASSLLSPNAAVTTVTHLPSALSIDSIPLLQYPMAVLDGTLAQMEPNATTTNLLHNATISTATTLAAAAVAANRTSLLGNDSGGGGGGISGNGGGLSGAGSDASDSDGWFDDTILVLKAFVMLFIIIAAIFGNLLVIISVMRVRKLR